LEHLFTYAGGERRANGAGVIRRLQYEIHIAKPPRVFVSLLAVVLSVSAPNLSCIVSNFILGDRGRPRLP